MIMSVSLGVTTKQSCPLVAKRISTVWNILQIQLHFQLNANRNFVRHQVFQIMLFKIALQWFVKVNFYYSSRAGDSTLKTTFQRCTYECSDDGVLNGPKEIFCNEPFTNGEGVWGMDPPICTSTVESCDPITDSLLEFDCTENFAFESKCDFR